MTRRTLWILLLAGLSCGALVVRWFHHRHADRPAYVTRAVDSGPITATVTATGTLAAVVQVDVGTQVSGTISELDCDFNSVVKKGQVLARIDPSLFRAAVEQGHANLSAARAALLKAEANVANTDRIFERDQILAKQELVAPQDVDAARAAAGAARADVESAKAAIEQAQAALDTASVNLRYSVIYAPVSGVVIARDVQVGQTVAASFASPTLFTIAQDLTEMEVDASMAEADVDHLQPGQEVRFTVDAYPGDVFHAHLLEVRDQPVTVQNVVTYVAVIRVENKALKLKPGMTANVQVVVGEDANAVRVANAALRFRPPVTDEADGAHADPLPPGSANGDKAGERAVYVLAGARLERRLVHIGLSDGTYSEVLGAGLAPGEQVVTDVATSGGDGPARPHHEPF